MLLAIRRNEPTRTVNVHGPQQGYKVVQLFLQSNPLTLGFVERNTMRSSRIHCHNFRSNAVSQMLNTLIQPCW